MDIVFLDEIGRPKVYLKELSVEDFRQFRVPEILHTKQYKERAENNEADDPKDQQLKLLLRKLENRELDIDEADRLTEEILHG